MADFSVKTTGLSAPDLKAASHISEGVQDVSGAMRVGNLTNLIKGGSEIAGEVYKQAKVQDFSTATQDTIQQYMDMRENPELAKGSLTGAAATDVQSSLFPQSGEQLSSVEKAQKERLSTYQQALSEGVMTPDEFSDRVLSNLREATNKNPGLYQELKAEAARVLELSGITGIVKSDQLQAEAKQKQIENLLKDMQERARKENIYYDVTTSYWDLAQQVEHAEKGTRSYNMQVRGTEQFKMLSQEQARKWVETNGNDVVRGGLSNANKVVFDMIDNLGITADSYPKYKAQLSSQFDGLKEVFRASIPVNILQDPNVQANLKAYNDGLDSVLKRFDNLVTGEDFKKVASNEFEILKMSQETHLRKTVDVPSIELSTKLAAAVPGIVTQSPEYRQKIYDAGVALSQGNYQSPAIQEMIPKSPKDNKSAFLIKGAINVGLESGDYTGFNRTLEAVNTTTTNIENPKTRLQFLYNNLSAIAEQKPMQLDVATIGKVETSIGQLLHDNNFGIETLNETSAGKKVKMDVLPSGHLMFTGEDAGKFNATYANNVNIALRAYANAHNQTMSEAAKRFYPQYFSGIVNSNSVK